MKKRVPYGIMNYAELVRKQCYWVDKTPYLAQLETVDNPVFLRPRRFGKSLWCSLLVYYYDLAHAASFDELFGHTRIGQHPTATHNQLLMLSLDFSPIAVGPTIKDIERSFNAQINIRLLLLRTWYAPLLDQMPEMVQDAPVADNLSRLLAFLASAKLPPLYVIIDEYDNFANQLIIAHKDQLYRELTADDSFSKAFFKTLKDGRKTGAVANVFITGVLPITIDDLASGFNIANFLTLTPKFEAMLGFTQTEVEHLLDEVYQDYQYAQDFRGVFQRTAPH